MSLQNDEYPESRQSRVTALVEGAVLAAIAAILGLAGLFFPPVSLITNFIWIIPIIILCLRWDMRTGSLALVVATILMMLLATPARGLFLVLEYGLTALIYGYAFKKSLPVGRTLLFGSLAAAVGAVTVFFLSIWITGFSLQQLHAQLQATVEQTMELYRSLGALDIFAQRGVSEEQLRSTLGQMVTLSISLLPGIMVVSALANALLSFLLSRKILQKMRIKLTAVPPFTTWRLPWYFIWGFILGLGSLLLGDYAQINLLKLVGQNILLVYLPVFFIIGLAIVKYYTQKVQISPFFKVFLVVLALLYIPMAVMSLMFLGMFDTLFNYRRL